MRIVAYALPLRRPYVWAKGTTSLRTGMLVEDGGWGEIALPPHVKLDGTWLQAARGGVHDARIRCGKTEAAADKAARSDGVPLWQHLAKRFGTQGTPSVAVNGLIEALPPELAAGRAAHLVKAGFACLKIKGDADDGATMARLGAVRSAAPRAALRLDLNGSWDLATWRRHLPALRDLGLEYVEQPFVAQEDLLAAIPDDIPIALDESATPETLPAFVGRPITVVLKPQRLGGPAGVANVARLAREQGWPFVITNSLESAVGRVHALHVACALGATTACGLATDDFLAKDVGVTPPAKDGRMAAPAGPGIGIQVDV